MIIGAAEYYLLEDQKEARLGPGVSRPSLIAETALSNQFGWMLGGLSAHSQLVSLSAC